MLGEPLPNEEKQPAVDLQKDKLSNSCLTSHWLLDLAWCLTAMTKSIDIQ